MSIRVLEAASVGLLVPAILGRAHSATVLAAFDKSFYLQTEQDLFAVAAAPVHDGPLTIRLRGDERLAALADLMVVRGQNWTIGPTRLQSTDGTVIDLEPASVWRPSAASTPIERERLASGLGHLDELLNEAEFPDDGLIHLVVDRSPPASPIQQAAEKPLAVLRRSMAEAFVGKVALDARSAIDLLGLGLGLTPSGDDLLVGLLLAFRLLGEHKIADELGKTLLQAARERTNPISLAHLEAAASGYGAAPLHDLLSASMRGERRQIAGALDAAAKIGHSSGFDALSGIVLAFRAWLQATA